MPAREETAETYDVKQFERPSVTVDVIIFTVKDNDLKVLLIRRDVWPFEHYWALPGGFIRMDESLERAAQRKLHEEAGVKDVYLEQLYSFGNPGRDPRTRVITVAYFALVNSGKIKAAARDDVKWFSVGAVPRLAFDHNKILEYALKRLRWKLEYTTAAYSLLPDKFTLTDLQKAYETILGRGLDKRNFRKKVFALGILEDTKETKREGPHRPARLYSFRRKAPEILEIL